MRTVLLIYGLVLAAATGLGFSLSLYLSLTQQARFGGEHLLVVVLGVSLTTLAFKVRDRLPLQLPYQL